jgi:hypothetical protein
MPAFALPVWRTIGKPSELAVFVWSAAWVSSFHVITGATQPQ